jgi:hypothetical protein
VVDTSEHAMKLRLIVSSPSAGQSWDLCCLVREGVIVFLQRTQPHALPRLRAAIQAPLQRDDPAPQPTDAPALHPARRPARTEAAVNNETGMAGLTAPTGGVVPPPSRPE